MSQLSLYMPGPRILTHGMPDLVWTGGRHVAQFLYNQYTSVHVPVVLGGDILINFDKICNFPKECIQTLTGS